MTSLTEFNELICECQKCPLGKTRNKFVFGSGNHNAKVMVVGEGPGADEDASGLPFVGRAGELLTKMMAAIGFSREEIFIANVVKCRPPGNRTPNDSEITECLPYLLKQIQLIKPVMILCAGTTAIQALMGRKGSLGSFRSQFYNLEDALVLATYHPAALIRNPEWKKPAWEDLKMFRSKYNELTGEIFEIKG
ncbi:MAG: uracil-DNA glycosylase [Ignavibacteriaceae bacterium]|nr:uracil-DNA glycosylase [Ignavibacteriaceae bacterium]